MAQPPNLLLTMLLKHGLALLFEAEFELNLSLCRRLAAVWNYGCRLRPVRSDD